MSYQLGSASRPRLSRVQKFSGTRLVRVQRPLVRRAAQVARGPRLPNTFMESSNYGTGRMNLEGFTRTLAGCDDALGFSLKPPKFIRKAATAIKKNVTLKRALVGGAIIGAAFIPGVAPAAMAVARGAGSGAARAGRGLLSLFRGKPKPFGPQETPEDQQARRDAQAAQAAEDAKRIADAYRAAQGAGQPPPDSAPTYGPSPSGPSAGGTSNSGGGGSAPGPAPADAPLPDDTEVDASMVKPNGPEGFSAASAMPLLLGIGAILLLNRPRGKRRAA